MHLSFPGDGGKIPQAFEEEERKIIGKWAMHEKVRKNRKELVLPLCVRACVRVRVCVSLHAEIFNP